MKNEEKKTPVQTAVHKVITTLRSVDGRLGLHLNAGLELFGGVFNTSGSSFARRASSFMMVTKEFSSSRVTASGWFVIIASGTIKGK